MQDELLVVGFDLETGREVHIAEGPPERWKRLGYGGTGQLVCFYCFHGFEAPAGTRVPLVTRGRLGGKVRRHFAHPPGQAPAGGHGPETVWHITTKHLLAAWAGSKPGVDRVRLEQWTDDHDRRADVEVLLRDGTKIALEAQRKLMTDDGWRARHRDYARQGVVDVWFWRPRVHFPHVVLDEGLPVWFYSVSKREAATSLGVPHARPQQWWQAPDLSVFGLHHPPCPLDELERVTMPLAKLGLGSGGAVLPEGLRQRVLDSQQAAQDEAKQRRDGEARSARAVREARERAARAPAPLPLPLVPAGGLRCEVCRRPLDPLLGKNRRHLLC
ncbi:competence protein CoiA family protein [Streptomyces sp. NRRL S-241]|uniref:competence protein CoiA family protein n=1 Tax=Streptomyces sp. NRRL S-241 TaxID=1463896 RepID=UPI0006918BE1|nr:competence protein CoiA family protein [Streptomyces sp. NRRL S-241]